MVTELAERFATTCRSAGIDEDGLGTELLGRWQEVHRRYHTVDHLRSVLHALDRIAATGDPVGPAVELAAWFHDAIYDPSRPGNEAASASLARSRLESRSAAPDLVDDVQRLVLVTAGHQPRGVDEASLVDADLSVLAGTTDEYATYLAAVRAEYAAVPEERWRVGRSGVLRDLLRSRPLFHTSAFTPLEDRARHNLETELAALTGRR